MRLFRVMYRIDVPFMFGWFAESETVESFVLAEGPCQAAQKLREQEPDLGKIYSIKEYSTRVYS